MTKGEQKKRIHELIQQAIDCDVENVQPTRFTQLQLAELIDHSLILQERMWQVYRFKFLATFVLFGLTDQLTVSDSLNLARQIRNANEHDELFFEFFCMLQETYVDGLEGGDDE